MDLIRTPNNSENGQVRAIIKKHLEINPFTEIVANGRKIIWTLPNENAWWRARNLLTAEVETIAWLDAFEPADTLLDVGANMGLYSLYAAQGGNRVFAFEPESTNFALLNTNIFANQLSDKVTAWCVALSNKDGLDRFYLSKFLGSGSGHSFGECVTDNLQPRSAEHVQGAVGVRLDSLIKDQSISIPQHIKIDVDGFEHKVIEGGLKTLASPHLKSVLVEMNRRLPEHRDIFRLMKECGFHCSDNFMRLGEFREGHFSQVGNILFARSLEWAEEIARVGQARFESDSAAQEIKRHHETGQMTPLTGAFPEEKLHLSLPKLSELIVESVESQSDGILVKGWCRLPEHALQLSTILKADGKFKRSVSEPILTKGDDRSNSRYRFQILCQ